MTSNVHEPSDERRPESASRQTAEDEQEAATDQAVHILLIEDNPGDARLIREMLRDSEELTQRFDLDERTGDRPTVTCESRLEDGLEALETARIDVVLLDLNLPDSDGLETLETVHETVEAVPIVVLTGVRDQEIGVRAIQRGAQDFLVKDEVTTPLLVRTIYHAIERARQRRERRRRRRQMEALNRLNRIAHDTTHAVITSDTRRELEQQVCDRLVESDAYQFAWIGGVSPGSDEVTPRARAGSEREYLDRITVTAGDDKYAQGPGGTALQTQEVQITTDVRTDPDFKPWRDVALEYGYRSVASIPISHEELVYGVLIVYSTTVDAFTGPERDVLSRMGDVIGHAITAIERREALVSDAVIELEFQIDELAAPLVNLSTAESVSTRFNRLIWEGKTLLAYGSAEGISQDTFRETVGRTTGFEDVRFLTNGDEEFEFELAVPAVDSLFETIATHGGRITSVTIDDGEFRFAVQLPQGRDTRRIVELVREGHENVSYLSQRSYDQRDTGGLGAQSVLQEKLTEKQRVALETAYAAGYFDWPRGSTGEEIAERLDISPATLNQHLRTAERKFFDSMFESSQQNEP
ncbi:diguanylate cyclase [Halostagnicola larsenii XH-48]|uniref:Diguanylate cyclase n=1 Tax=Halostagnicola larsenii XH-48 TaxID=797299 RepID=W0JMX1_9EURY|nr:bacterio-opsin activator domain-containing protein [Halostagnicola larsenii]AHF98661.1 diguanylate cyclase [Halostagnicola larsenii XH-48]